MKVTCQSEDRSKANAKPHHHLGMTKTKNQPMKRFRGQRKSAAIIPLPERSTGITIIVIAVIILALCLLGSGEALRYRQNEDGYSTTEKKSAEMTRGEGRDEDDGKMIGDDEKNGRGTFRVETSGRAMKEMFEIDDGGDKLVEGVELRRALPKHSRKSIIGASEIDLEKDSTRMYLEYDGDASNVIKERKDMVDRARKSKKGEAEEEDRPLVHPLNNDISHGHAERGNNNGARETTSNLIQRDQTFAHDFKSRSSSFKKLVDESNVYSLKRKAPLPDNGLSETSNRDVDGITSEIDKILSSIPLVSADDINTGSDKEVLEALVLAISRVKDRISDSQLASSMPANFQPIFRTLLHELSIAEKYMKAIEGLVSEHSNTDTDSRRRILSSEGDASTKYRYDSGISKADYHIRSKSHHRQKHHGSGKLVDHQQGYHRARASRQEGGMRRRLSQDNGSVCVDVDPVDRKEEQCFRLANCSRNYNLYDLFVFLFGDDINFDTGTVDKKEKIKAEVEIKLLEKLDRIKQLSGQILLNYIDGQLQPDSFIFCDQLLQEFHRFDEDLSVKGKWQGGSVTGICRGWGTNKFMTLESVYYISDAVLNVKEKIEDCLEDLVREFNYNLENFTAPLAPCKEEFGDIEFFGDLNTSTIMNDIRRKFQCLYYSYLKQTLGEPSPCTNVNYTSNGCDETACRNMKNYPVFAAKDRFDNSFSCRSSGAWFWKRKTCYTFAPSFKYEIPAILPSREDRVKSIVLGDSPGPFTSYSYGRFLLDSATLADLTGESFIIEVFNEYIGCASDLVKNLLSNGEHPPPIFSGGSTMYNPYAPDPTKPKQLQMPLTIDDTSIDEHGQLQVEYLDEIFTFVPVGSVNAGEQLAETGGVPKLSDELKIFLAKVYNQDQAIDDEIQIFDVCQDDDKDAVANYCKGELQNLKVLRDKFFSSGLDRSSLDTSIALIFGNKTTVGQVCSFTNGLKDGTVDDVPGFCCLDAPYESLDWGEKFSCEKYVSLADGSTKVVQKDTIDCLRLGPVTSGFNEAACDIFHGTWCPNPRSCSGLVICIKNAKEDVIRSRDRQAFFEYLDEAPEVKDPDDPTKCGDLREYFDYERDYPDDERICEEVLDLQCFTDFSNLDGFATGTAGPGGGMEELAVSEKVKLISKTPFDPSTAKTWRSANFRISKIIEFIEFVLEQLDASGDLCTVAISAVPGTSASCTVPLSVSKIVTASILFALKLAIDISERIYSEIVDAQDADYEDDRQQSNYENAITNHGNIITTFYATQQLKVILGDISEGLANEEEEEDQRRRLSDCVSTVDGFVSGCDKPSCEDPTRICDGSFNFPYIAFQKGAGCDTLDSDGDGKYDVCEDRFPPDLVVRNAEIFRCDEDDDKRLCHDGNVFKNEKEVKHFLKYQFPAIDDCASTDKLDVKIEYERGSCQETFYRLMPIQDISTCDGRGPVGAFNIAYENPLRGTSREVAVQLDNEAPVVQCGFRPPDSSSINVVAGKILYHYMLDFGGDGLRLHDARFYYDIADNCENDVHINVVVKSNEIQQNDIAKLSRYNPVGFVEQTKFLYAGTSCQSMGEDLFCEEDHSIRRLKVRFYDITVSAIDSAGNAASDTCKVVVVPRCSRFNGCEKYPAGGNLNVEGFYYPLDDIEKVIAQSQVLHRISEEKLVWDHRLDFYYPEPKQNECEDHCPPTLIVHNAEIFQCDWGDKNELCYDGKVFNNGDQVVYFLEHHFSATDDCSSTSKLDVKIKHTEGSCRSTIYTLTPVHVCDDTEPVEMGHSSIVHSYKSPQHVTSKKVKVHLDDKAPVIQCGFRLDDSSINTVEGKTLYHYMLDSSRDGLDGLRLDDARFFYNVTENCEDNLRIDIVVESNEIQQNQIAKLFKYNMGGSVQQAKFLYSGTSCENMGDDFFCEQDPTMDSLKVRFYKIVLTAYDSAGNAGSDTCEVVIVPKCYPSLFGQCEKYETRSSKSSISSRKLNHKDNYYYTREFVEAAVAKSEVLYRVVEAELVWKHGLNYPQKDMLQPRKGKSAKSEIQGAHTQAKKRPREGKVGERIKSRAHGRKDAKGDKIKSKGKDKEYGS